MRFANGVKALLFALFLTAMAVSAFAFTVSGTITDGSGLLADATVTIYLGNAEIATLTTLADGAYAFTVDAGTYSVRAVKEGYLSPNALPVTVVDMDLTGLDIILDQIFTVTGTVALEDAASPEGTRVTLEGYSNLQGYTTATTTALADGSYSFQTTAGSYTVYAWKPFYDITTADTLVSGDVTVPLITLPAVGVLTISGTIIDESGPVSGVKVRATCDSYPDIYYESTESVNGAYTIEVPDDWYTLWGYTLSIPRVPYGFRVASAPLDIVFPMPGSPVTGQDFVLATVQRLVDVTSDDFIPMGPRGTLTSWQNHGTLGGYFTPFGTGTSYFDVVDGLHAAKFNGNSSLRLRDQPEAPAVDLLMPDENCGNAAWTVSTWARQAVYVSGVQPYFIWAPTSPADPLPGDHVVASCHWGSGGQGAFRNAGTPPHVGYADLGWAGGVSPSTEVWHNLTLVYDGQSISAYLDGELSSSKICEGPLEITPQQPINIGSRYTQITSTSADQFFYGSISRLVMLDGPVDPADVPTFIASIKPADALMHLMTVVDPGPGGTITPGTTSIPDGDSITFTIAPNIGYVIQDVVVDGVSQGPVTTVAFENVTSPHTVSASFAEVPKSTISGVVTDKSGNPIAGATIHYSGSPNASLSTLPTATTAANGTYILNNVPQGNVYVSATAAGYWNSADQLVVLGSEPGVADFVLAPEVRNIPNTTDLFFSAFTDTFPAANGELTGDWACYLPKEVQPLPILDPFVAMFSPTVEYVDNIKWEQNQNIVNNGDGYRVMGPITNTYPVSTPSQTIPCNGATIVAVARPVRDGVNNRGSVVNIFRQNLVLAVNNSTGRVAVLRNATNINNYVQSSTIEAIPSGQKTILSLVVQPDGAYKVYANGQMIMDVSSATLNGYGGTFTAFVPNQQGAESTKKYVNIGRSNADTNSYFNGNIGDVFVYKTALTDADRQALEADLKDKFGIVTHTITATAGDNGTISPAGEVIVTHGADRIFTITPNEGYEVNHLVVDGVIVPPATSYTFPAVDGDHTFEAVFSPLPTITINPPSAAITNGEPVSFIVSYGNVDGDITLSSADITLNATGTAAGNVEVSGTGLTERTVTITGITGEGTLSITIAPGTAYNSLGTLVPEAGPSEIVTVELPLVAVANLAELKAKAGTGEIVQLSGTVTVTAIAYGWFFVGEEQFKGCIKVESYDVVAAGSYITGLTGTVAVDAYGQYTITLTAPVVPAAPGNVINPIGVNNKAAKTDPKLLTNLVRIWGSVGMTGLIDYTLSDGYSSPIGVWSGMATIPTNFGVVTGILWQEGGDVVLYQTP